ncbi:MAG: hypothetical protein GXO43_06025 [Crenarchaeota archaeon]|nr:hypothetical protein [Thermoproteota archaeon]
MVLDRFEAVLSFDEFVRVWERILRRSLVIVSSCRDVEDKDVLVGKKVECTYTIMVAWARSVFGQVFGREPVTVKYVVTSYNGGLGDTVSFTVVGGFRGVRAVKKIIGEVLGEVND